MELLCDCHHGVYIPQIMARRLHDAGWSGIDLGDVVELEAGPYDCEWYWDIWNNILDNAAYTDENNQKWYLHQDGDLFAVTKSELENLDF